jgi:hypothetical protein
MSALASKIRLYAIFMIKKWKEEIAGASLGVLEAHGLFRLKKSPG